jgi:hypothetical protein
MNIDPGKYYKIIAKSSGKCLDVAGGPGSVAYDGPRIHQWEYVSGENQKWRFQDVGAGCYALFVKNSTRCLTVAGGPKATSNGTEVQLWNYLGDSNQKWRLQGAGGGEIVIFAENSGKCLEVKGGPEANENAGQVQQWDHLGKDNQKWQLVAVEAAAEGGKPGVAMAPKTRDKRPADRQPATRERIFKLVHGQLEDFKNPANAVTTELNRPDVGEVLNLSITFTVGYGNMIAVGIVYEKAPSASVT